MSSDLKARRVDAVSRSWSSWVFRRPPFLLYQWGGSCLRGSPVIAPISPVPGVGHGARMASNGRDFAAGRQEQQQGLFL